MDQWWNNKEIVSQIVDWAYELQEKQPQDKIISLGQSPSWIVLCVGMIRKLNGFSPNTCYVPFTGAFVKRTSSKNLRMSFEERGVDHPLHEDRIAKYFNYLGLIGAHPEQVFQQEKPVLLTEMIKGGNGLASFLSIWLGQLSESQRVSVKTLLKTHIYDTNPNFNADEMRIIGNGNFLIDRRPLDKREADIMEGITPLNIAEVGSSRLVPMYRLSARYPDVGLELIPNLAIRKRIKQALHKEVQARHQVK
jgi:hypothetical protein